MDRRVLSDPRVVRLSRDFVCVRPLSYEDAEETEFLGSLFRTRSGSAENTAFCLLAPDGETKLTRAGRSPSMVFGGTDDESTEALVQSMEAAIETYPGKSSAKGDPALPAHTDLRRGLNTAACDLMPLVVVRIEADKDRKRAERALAELAWDEDFIGHLAFVSATEDELKAVGVQAGKDAVLVLAPDDFGVEGELLETTGRFDAKSLRATLAAALAAHSPEAKNWSELSRKGRREGIRWESAVESTDPGKAPREPGGERGRRGR